MRNLLVLILCVVLFDVSSASPQGQTAAQASAETLRAQLLDVETKQGSLQTRLQDLEEKLKPENIEKALAGVGSTKPEEVREQRRRELEIERNGVRAQLDLLATSHTRLETAIARAARKLIGKAPRLALNPPQPSSLRLTALLHLRRCRQRQRGRVAQKRSARRNQLTR
jgi:flagellar capping protein FliD